jgi:hypothetical protein
MSLSSLTVVFKSGNLALGKRKRRAGNTANVEIGIIFDSKVSSNVDTTAFIGWF